MPPILLVATRNPGKMREYRELLARCPASLVSLDDVGITEEVEETGHTFLENAHLKAAAYATLSGCLTLSDDSGLEVHALGGAPGVYSARYGGAACVSDTDRVDLLLRNLQGIPWVHRMARFRCFHRHRCARGRSSSRMGYYPCRFRKKDTAALPQSWVRSPG